MKKLQLLITWVALLSMQSYAQNPSPGSPQDKAILIKDVTVHIGNGKEIQDGAVGFRDGKINFVGSAALAPSGYDEILSEKGKHLYPGFIAVNSTLGLTEIGAVRASRDEKETGVYNPHVRSIIAYNTDSRITPTVRANGVLMAQISPQGGRIAGSSSVVHLDAWNWEDAVYEMDEGIHLNWPSSTTYNWRKRLREVNENYDKEVNSMKEFLQKSKGYCNGPKEGLQLRETACCGLFDSEKTLYVHSNRANEMISAINMAQDLGIEKLVIVGGYDAHLITDLLKDRKVAVMISKVHGVPEYADDEIDHNFKVAKTLSDAGVLFCLENSARMTEMNTMNLPFQAGTCIAYGLDRREALAAITLNAATILGIEERCGSLVVGKDATLFLSTGDALDMRTNNVERAYIQGRTLDLDNHQKQNDHKYRQKYGLQ